MSAAAQLPVHDSAAPARRMRVRLTSLGGTLAAGLLVLSFFLPWVRVAPEAATSVRDTLVRESEARDPPSAAAGELLAVAEELVRSGSLRGTDMLQWAHAGQALARELDKDPHPGIEAQAHERRLLLARGMLHGIPLAALLLALYFIFHRFRRARLPVLVLAILAGLAAFVLAAMLNYAHGVARLVLPGAALDLAEGWTLMVVGGAGLALAGAFGVRRQNWFGVYAASLTTGAALALLALHYLAGGDLPWPA